MLIYRTEQGKYTGKQRLRERERERDYTKFLAQDTLCVSTYKRHVYMYVYSVPRYKIPQDCYTMHYI